jgi:hypothetical protein
MISIKFHSTNTIGKLATAEIHFLDGEFAGLALYGFGVWEDRQVTFPGTNTLKRHDNTRQQGFSRPMLRPISVLGPIPTLTQEILGAYDEYAAAIGWRQPTSATPQ